MQERPFVLRRYDLNPNTEWIVSTYSETLASAPVELNGTIAATIFSKDINAFLRATRLGWIDETEKYYRERSKDNSVETKELKAEKEKTTVKTTTKKARGRPKKSK